MNKKRILGMFGACLMLTAGLSITANAETLEGDHNGDGVVNAKDAAIILIYAAEFGAGNFQGTFTEFKEYTSKTSPTENVPVNTALDYDKIYSDYLYNTLIPKAGRAALNVTFTKEYDLNDVTGVVSTAIYDFDQDNVKELLVVTREADASDDNYLDTAFVLNL